MVLPPQEGVSRSGAFGSIATISVLPEQAGVSRTTKKEIRQGRCPSRAEGVSVLRCRESQVIQFYPSRRG